MIDSRFVKLVIQFALGVGLILAAMLLFKTQSATVSYVIPTVQSAGTLRSYHSRMRAAERELGVDEFDNIYGSPGPMARK